MSISDSLMRQLKNNLILKKDLDTQPDFNFYNENRNFFYSSSEEYATGTNVKFFDERTKFSSSDSPNEKKIQLIKSKAVRTLRNEDIAVGYSSVTERIFSDLLKKDVSLLKDVLNLIYIDVFDEAELLQKFIEVMSNLDYELLYPTNTILALGVINYVDVGVQEAGIAAIEKWDDKRNIKILENVNYTTGWIEKYAEEVIDYLESC